MILQGWQARPPFLQPIFRSAEACVAHQPRGLDLNAGLIMSDKILGLFSRLSPSPVCQLISQPSQACA